MTGPLQTTVRPRLPVDLDLTLGGFLRATGRCLRREPNGTWWRATSSPEGPATLELTPSSDGVAVRAWGPGSAWALDTVPELLGSRDSLDGFDPGPGLVRELHRRMPGLRVPRSNGVFEALVPVVLEQKVPGEEARRTYANLVRAFGEPAPGPGGLLVPPAPAALAGAPYPAFHPLGIERRRADTLRAAAARSVRLEETLDMAMPDAYARMLAFPGIGQWTAARVAMTALGDADAVPLGDYHLPHAVAWGLAGEPRGTDERMLELLAPFEGHRGRVLRLFVAGGIGAPRFGPRMALRSIADI